MQLGPEELGGRSILGSITVRRYRCLRCRAVLIVIPRGMLPRLRYTAVAVALALARWGVEGVPSPRVREEVSPFSVVGHDARRGWGSLRRWAAARGSPWPVRSDADDARARARDIVQHLAGHALEPGPLTAQACEAAARVMPIARERRGNPRPTT